MRDGIDAALEIAHRNGPEYGPGASNHAPMAIEAMTAMGRGGGIIPWLEAYCAELDEAPHKVAPIAPDEWREALGDAHRVADWVAFFDREIAELGWQAAVALWVPRLAPALISRAAHGLIRTAHAVRSLAGTETAPRLHELAQGLGYWASTWQTLPGEPANAIVTHSPSQAIRGVRRLHEPGFVSQGLIWQTMLRMREQPDFVDTVNLAAPGENVSAFLSDLTETAARWYLSDRTVPFVFVHTLTAPSALRFIAPYLSDADASLTARYAWQACAAMYAWYMLEEPNWTNDPDDALPGRDELIDRAIHAAGPHAIKFTEACLREYELNPNPVYLHAAWDAAERIGDG